MFRSVRFFLFALLVCLSCNVAAFDFAGMYEVRVQQQGSDRNPALQQAFDTMLLRLTANVDLLSDERIGLLRRRVENYIQSYQYIDSGATAEQPWLRIVFDKGKLIKALSDLNIPSWGVNRPKTLVWLVVGDPEGGHRIIGRGDNHPALLELDRWSATFALPLVYPLLDLEDISKVDSSQLWAGFDENLVAASARYDSNAIALVRVDGWQRGQWRLRWQLYMGEEKLLWDDVSIGIDDAAETGIGRLAAELSLRFGLDNLDEQNLNSFSIKVAGVTSFDHMAKVVAYLSEVHAIRDVQLQGVRRGELQINLVATLDKSGVHNAIALSTLLIPLDVEQDSYRFNAEFN